MRRTLELAGSVFTRRGLCRRAPRSRTSRPHGEGLWTENCASVVTMGLSQIDTLTWAGRFNLRVFGPVDVLFLNALPQRNPEQR